MSITHAMAEKAVILAVVYESVYPLMLLAGFPPVPPSVMFTFGTIEQWEEILHPVCLLIVQNLPAPPAAGNIDAEQKDEVYYGLASVLASILTYMPPEEVGKLFFKMFPPGSNSGGGRRRNAADLNLFNTYFKNSGSQSGGDPFYIRNGQVINASVEAAAAGTTMYTTRAEAQAAIGAVIVRPAEEREAPQALAVNAVDVLLNPELLGALPVTHLAITAASQEQIALSRARRSTDMVALATNREVIDRFLARVGEIHDEVVNDIALLRGSPTDRPLSAFGERLKKVLLLNSGKTELRERTAATLRGLRGKSGGAFGNFLRGAAYYGSMGSGLYLTYTAAAYAGNASSTAAAPSPGWGSSIGGAIGGLTNSTLGFVSGVAGGFSVESGLVSSVAAVGTACIGALSWYALTGVLSTAQADKKLTDSEQRLVRLLDEEALMFGAAAWESMTRNMLTLAQSSFSDEATSLNFIQALQHRYGAHARNEPSLIRLLNTAYKRGQENILAGVPEVYRARGHATISPGRLGAIEAIIEEVKANSKHFKEAMDKYASEMRQTRNIQIQAAMGAAEGLASAGAYAASGTGHALNFIGQAAGAMSSVMGTFGGLGASLAEVSQPGANASRWRVAASIPGRVLGRTMQAAGMAGQAVSGAAVVASGVGRQVTGAASSGLSMAATGIGSARGTVAASQREAEAAAQSAAAAESATLAARANTLGNALRGGPGAPAAAPRLGNGAGAGASALQAMGLGARRGQGGAAGRGGGGRKTRKGKTRKNRKSRKLNRR